MALPVAIVIDKAASATVTVGDGPFTYDATTHMRAARAR